MKEWYYWYIPEHSYNNWLRSLILCLLLTDNNSNVAISLDNSISGVLSLRAIYCTGLENRLIDCPFHGNYSLTGACKRNDLYHYAAINCTDGKARY